MSNNRTKLFLLFTMIFIATIGISAATAADTDNNATDAPVIAETPTTDVVDNVQTTDVDNKAEITKNTQTNVKTATLGYLNDLATDINGSSEFTLTRDYSGKTGLKYIQLNNSLTIDGAGHTISNLTQGLFEITAGNTLKVKNLKLTGGKFISYHVFQVKGNLICENVTVDFKDLPSSSNRKAIVNLMANNTNVSLINCTIKNYASNGSVYATDACAGTLLMDNCIIQNNTPGSYGLVIVDAPGSNATIKNTKFIKNIGISQFGGAIGVKNAQTNAIIENCLFDGNAANYFGGAIYVKGNVTVKNSVFKDNYNLRKPGTTSNGTFYVSGGGFLYVEGNTMDDLTPAEIYVAGGNVSSPILKSVDVAANPNEEVNITYTLTDDMGNSIIYSMASYTITIGYDTHFAKTDNVLGNNGTITVTFKAPSIEARYPVSITFRNVYTIEGHDVIIINPTLVVGNVGYDINLTDETWDQYFNEDGTPKEDVVGVYDILKFNGKFTNRHMNINFPLTITTGETQAVLDGCTIKSNSEISIKNIKATNSYVEVLDGKKLNLTNSAFANTTTNTSIINIGKNTIVNVEKSNFTNISAEGVFTIDSDSIVQIKESKFKNCTSNTQGGAIITKENSNVTFDECEFRNNSAGLRGGAICSYGNLTVKNSQFVSNKVLSTTFAKDQGGAAIYVEGNVWLYDNFMDKNTGLTGDIYNGGAVIHTPVIIVFEDIDLKQGSEIRLLGMITDNDGDTLDFYADMKDGDYYLNHNLTVDGVKYDLTRNQTLKGMIDRPINDSLAPGNYTVSIEVDANEIPDAKIYPGKLEIIPIPRPNVNLTDETWNQFFNEDGTLKNGIVNEGDELQFYGTFNNRNMNITTPITVTTGEDQAVFNGCTFTISSPTTIKNVQFTGTTSSHTITANANLTFENVTFDAAKATEAYLINPAVRANITFNNCTVNNFEGNAIVRSSAKRTGITVTVIDSVFKDNNAAFSAFCEFGNGWTINLTNSNFTNNNGQNGGVIQGMSTGTTLKLYIDNCNFQDNTATGKAGVIYSASNNAIITITNSNFTDNKVTSTSTGSTPTNLASTITLGTGNTNLTLNNNIMTGSTAENATDIYYDTATAGTGKIFTDAKLTAENKTTDKDQFVDLKFKLTDDMGNLIAFKTPAVFNYTATLNDEEISYTDSILYGRQYGFYASANKTLNATYPGGLYPITLTVTTGADKFDSLEIVNGQLEVIAPKPTPTINYEIVNDIEGKVAIKFTVVDEEENEITPAQLILNGDITATVNANKAYKNTNLTAGEYAVNVKFEETDDYQEATLNFTLTVQKDPQAIIDELNQSIISNETALNNTLEEIAALEQENNNLKEQVENLTSELNNTQAALTEAQAALENATNTITQLEQNITTLTQELNDTQTALTEAEAAKAQLEEENANLTAKVAELEEALANNQTALQEAQEIITQLNENITALETQLNNTQEALTEAQNKITEFNDNITSLEEELAEAQRALNESEEENANLTAKIAELEEAIAANQTALEEAQETITQLNENITALETQLNNTQQALTEAQETITQLNENITTLEEELNQTEAELADTQQALANANDEIESLNDQIDALEEELEQTESELADTQQVLEEANETIDELEYKASELELALNLTENALDKVIDALEELNKPKETSISIDPITDAKYGDEINITGLLVNEDAIGLANQPVTITFNGEEIQATTRNGEFTYTTTATIVGENTVTVTYAGSDKYTESTATYTFNVTKADTYINITEIESVKKGETTSIAGILYDGNGNALANKVVRLLVNNGRKTVKTNDMGEFSFDYTTTKVGNITVTATYEGNDLYESTTSETQFTVNKLNTIITIDPIETVIKGTQTTITGTLTDENGNAIANAQVKININGSPKTLKTDSEGRFTHTYTFGKVGENTITATYAGNTNYDETEVQTTVEVTKAQAVITLDDITDVTKGETATFTGKLTDEEGNAIANAQVKLNINGSQKTLTTDADGAFTHTFKMIKEGTNNITATFNGNNDFTQATTNSTVEVIKAE